MKLLVTTVADGDLASRRDVVLSADASTPAQEPADHPVRMRADGTGSGLTKAPTAPVCYLGG